jgi:hypothetical protein
VREREREREKEAAKWKNYVELKSFSEASIVSINGDDAIDRTVNLEQ